MSEHYASIEWSREGRGLRTVEWSRDETPRETLWAGEGAVMPLYLVELARSGQAASGRYLFSHPELNRYERMKRNWETTTPAGLLYGMFYSTGTVLRWMQQQDSQPRGWR